MAEPGMEIANKFVYMFASSATINGNWHFGVSVFPKNIVKVTWQVAWFDIFGGVVIPPVDKRFRINSKFIEAFWSRI